MLVLFGNKTGVYMSTAPSATEAAAGAAGATAASFPLHSSFCTCSSHTKRVHVQNQTKPNAPHFSPVQGPTQEILILANL
jgi:hypothetical protein